VVIQSDFFSEHQSYSLLPLTGELYPAKLFRIDIEPSSENGLDKASQVMMDKITSVAAARIKQKIGCIGGEQIEQIEVALTVWLGL
jgi:mRNA interferase MazF